METTLGKRIVAGRKKAGLTQDQLAERLGVTAQAVSKWENDQSCPDIAMLPRLAEIFGTSTDALLGMEQEPVREAEVVPQTEEEPEGIHFQNGNLDIRFGGIRKGAVGFALWVLLVGVLQIASALYRPYNPADLWHIAWTSGLMMFGLTGLYPRFSFLRLGCALIGGYYLICLNFVPRLPYNSNLLLPFLIALLGLSLLLKALQKGRKPHFVINTGSGTSRTSDFVCENERFSASTSFGENVYRVKSPRLSGGEAEVSFGEETVDLTCCESFAPGCELDLNCSFGQLTLLVPRTCRVRHDSSTAFGSVDFSGRPDDSAASEIFLNCSVSFGEISVKYI